MKSSSYSLIVQCLLCLCLIFIICYGCEGSQATPPKRGWIPAGPGVKGEPAAGGTGVYGKTYYSEGGYSGHTEILDEEGNYIGDKFFGHPPPLPSEGGDFWTAVPWEGTISYTEDGTIIIYNKDGEVIAKVPPVVENPKPANPVERQWIPLPHGGGFWVYTNTAGQVVDVNQLQPDDPSRPKPPFAADILWPQPE